jgi:serine/threonine protein phosphatase PrpC
MLVGARSAIMDRPHPGAAGTADGKEGLMITCVQCGTENRAQARFCMQCGAKLEMPPAELAPADEEELPEESPRSAEEVPAPAETTDDATNEAHTGQARVEMIAGLEKVASETVESPQEYPHAAPESAEVGWEEERVEETGELQEPEPSPLDEPAELRHPEIDEGQALEQAKEDAGESEPSIASASGALSPGTRLAERYEVTELIEETANTLIYDALDYGRCSECGYADSQLGDLYCAHCGASLEQDRDVPHIRLCALQLEGEAVIQLEDETAGRVERWFEWDGRLYAILPLPVEEPEEAPHPVSRGVRHIVGYSSDPGLQRELDEDAILALTLAPTFESRSAPSLGLYAVADGMGGHEGGEIASRLAIEELAQTILKRLLLPELSGEPVLAETPADLLRETIQSISTRIFEIQQATGSDLGTTLTAALVRDDVALIANVGDSRTYLWRDSQLAQITTDHSLVAQLVEAGALEPEEIYTHPDKSAIYRSLGHAPEVEVDLFRQRLEPGDRLLLCCDGVWEMLRSDGIEEVLLLEPEPQRACDELVRRANLAGGDDNISCVIVQFEQITANR